MKNLIAHVTFIDVDGNKIHKQYSDNGYMDLNALISSVGYHITSKDEFAVPRNIVYQGVNGTVDISKKITITIYPETHN